MRGLFVTGTDTGVGKTFVTGGLARLLCSRGLRVGVMKPIETGCARHGDDLVPSDAWQLMTAAGGQQDLSSVCPYRFEAALAPDVAARLEGCTIEPEVIQSRFQAIASSHDVVLVEGAGGLLVPIRGRYTMADLAVDLGLPMLVVTASRLGAVSHTLLTLAHAQSRDLTVAAYVLNQLSRETDDAMSTNADLLARSTDVPCAGVIEWTPCDPEGVAEAAASAVSRTRVDELLGELLDEALDGGSTR